MSKNIENLRSKFYERFVEWSSTSTSHGLPNIFRTHNIGLKIMWLLFFLFSTAICGFMIARSIIEYLNYDVVTKIRVLHENPSEFPTITICNINPFTKIKSKGLYKQVVEKYKNFVNFDQQVTVEDLRAYQPYFLLEAKNPEYGDENRTLLGPMLSEMLISCSFHGSDEECNESDFEWFYMIDNGNCFRFNSGLNSSSNRVPIKKAYRSGELFGFKIELLLDKLNTFSGVNSNNGIRIYIQNSSVYPKFYTDSIDVEPGTLTSISLKKELSESMPSPFSDCKSSESINSALNKKMRDYNKTYSQSECLWVCYQEKIISKCNCYDMWLENLNSNVKPCLNLTELNCSYEITNTMLKNERNYECIEQCPLECTTVSYEYVSSSSQYPSQRYFEVLKERPFIKRSFSDEGVRNITYDILRERLVSLSIYLKTLSYTKISESQKLNSVDLIAGIGGKYLY
jgi:hypothetical protein